MGTSNRGWRLQDMYFSSSNITSWTRDVVYFRPKVFVIYDRTIVGNTSGDQRLAFHFPRTPVEVTAPAAGTHRFDVSEGGTFVGSVTTLLPPNHQSSLTNIFNSDWVYRLTVRPSTQNVDTKWLTVLDASNDSASVYSDTVISSANGNASANVQGALMRSGYGNFMALFGTGAANAPITGTISVTMPGEQTRMVVTDLQPNTGYSVTAAYLGGDYGITIQAGSGFTSSSSGALYVDITIGGQVIAGK